MDAPSRDQIAERVADALGAGQETILELAALAVEQDRFRAAATAVATELATRLGFERVSIGLLRRGHVRVEALSHSARFEKSTHLVRDLADAMAEAADQDATLVHPPPAGAQPRIVRAHELLAKRHEDGPVCTVPLASGGSVVGALTCERRPGERLEPDVVQLVEQVAALLGPILLLKQRADARTLERGREFLSRQKKKLLGPGHATTKLVAGAVATGLVLLTLVPGTYRIAAEATLEGRVQRAVVAGFEGYIAEAHARAGDLVREGQLLARLDDRDLELERRKWRARREQYRREHREALAEHDRTQMSILSARLAEADAQLALLREQHTRTRLVAPFDGIVVEGDLSQALGSPVEKGAVLFEIAPLDGYRIILQVDERNIADVAPGARGRLSLSALPRQGLDLTVDRVTPVTTAGDGRNFFRVEARLDEPATSLQPGMEGIAKIEAGRRSLLWIWSHDLLDWLRLWAWSWWP